MDEFGVTSAQQIEPLLRVAAAIGLRSPRSASFERVHALAGFIEEQAELGCALLAHFSGDLDDAKTALENYAGRYEIYSCKVTHPQQTKTPLSPRPPVRASYACRARPSRKSRGRC
jgi:hypothetical protein